MKIKVLFVEDELVIADLICIFLNDFCEEVYYATNGEIAFEIYKKKEPDLIITDIQMPIMNGIKFIEKVREKDLKIPIYVTTAFGKDDGYTETLKKLKINGKFEKPIDLDDILNCILKHEKEL